MLANVVTKTARDRWKGMAIGAGALALFLLFGMAVYRDIDLSVYTDLPEAIRAVMGIGEGADAASLAYGVVYGSYGAMTLAGLALSMGSASIAGEERDGTMGLLLGNPISRTHVLLSKAASMVLVTGFGALVLWSIGRIAPVLLDVEVAGMQVEALAFHMYINALFYGFAAMALGAWTGNRGLASGATAGVMVVSFFAAGLFPVVEGLENLAKAFPWYYFDGSQPVLNGISWGHLGVLLTGCALLAVAAAVGVNRRDLRGHTVGVTLVDRLRSNPLTQKVADRLAGSTRVSRISIKTASDHQGLFLATAAVMFLVMGVLIGPMYNFIDEALRDFSDTFPEALMAMVGGGDMGTPEGWYQVETFGMMAPIAMMVVTVVIGARALAGEEARRTMGLLLANPVSRATVVIEKTMAMVVLAVALGIATFAGVAIGSLLGGLGISTANIAAITFLVTLLGLVFGALALALSAGTGRVKVAIFGTVGVALACYVANGFLPLNDSLAGYAKWSPFYYYMSSEPLINGMHWGHAAVLAALFLALVALSVVLFQRRDLRQTG
ncbi:MAG: ABC transporter permease [Acidimicrobiia bacterium]|nr:ABC transporter permease [Acidimicrobiia bacterium]